MPKDILVYGGIHDFSAELFIEAIGQAEEEGAEEITVRINSNGGSPESMYGMAAKMQSFEGTKNVKIDGKARSAGAFLALYADSVEALDVSSFMFHRASWGAYFEANYMDEDTKSVIVKINSDLRRAMEAKLDIPKFEKITGKTLDEIFSMEDRIDVSINAKQAKQVGLVDNIVSITPKKTKALNAQFQKIAAEFGTNVDLLEINSDISAVDENHKNKNMTIQDLKINHPSVYAEAVALGVAEGKSKEKERVSAWSGLYDVDAEAARAGIEGDAELTAVEAVNIVKDAEETRRQAEAAAKEAEANAEDLDTPNPNEEGEDAKALFPDSKYLGKKQIKK
ncbi:MAG: ATP-dependent Clp protease proteolytic subunit [Chlamydiia bacterium]|nr:ATP-dependent Clp protease proteolytic subunit [Chlamydiia bacterium]